MSEPVIAVPKPEMFDEKHSGGLLPMLSLVAVAGIVGSLIGALLPGTREQFAYSWLFAFVFFFTLCAGSLFWILVHHATDAAWSVVVRRVLENVAGLLPVVFLFLIRSSFRPISYSVGGMCRSVPTRFWTPSVATSITPSFWGAHAFIFSYFLSSRPG